MAKHKFKVGDKVRAVEMDHNHFTDFEADLMMDLQDGTVTGKEYDRTLDAIREQKVLVITRVDTTWDEPSYECKLGKKRIATTFVDSDLELA